MTKFIPPRRTARKPWSGLMLSLMERPSGVTRFVQRAGDHAPLSYRRGVCVRVPRNRILIATRSSIEAS